MEYIQGEGDDGALPRRLSKPWRVPEAAGVVTVQPALLYPALMVYAWSRKHWRGRLPDFATLVLRMRNVTDSISRSAARVAVCSGWRWCCGKRPVVLSLFCEDAAESRDVARNLIRAIVHGVRSAGTISVCGPNTRKMDHGWWVWCSLMSCLAHVLSHLAKKNWTVFTVSNACS